MLVLTRKNNESVVVGSEDLRRIVSVTVLEINGGTVRLGFEAVNGVAIHRSEVWSRIGASALEPNQHSFVQKGSGYGNGNSNGNGNGNGQAS